MDVTSVIAKALKGGAQEKLLSEVKTFALNNFAIWINKAMHETNNNIGELEYLEVSIKNFKQETEKTEVTLKGTRKPEPFITPDLNKEIAGKIAFFLPKIHFTPPTKQQIKEIQEKAKETGIYVPDKHQVIEAFRHRFEKERPGMELKDIYIKFDFANEEISIDITNYNGKKEIKAI